MRVVSTKFRAEISAMCQKTQDSVSTKDPPFVYDFRICCQDISSVATEYGEDFFTENGLQFSTENGFLIFLTFPMKTKKMRDVRTSRLPVVARRDLRSEAQS